MLLVRLCCAQLNWLRMVERILKLSLPSLYAWILGFFLLFHVWLNLLVSCCLAACSGVLAAHTCLAMYQVARRLPGDQGPYQWQLCALCTSAG